VTSIERPAFPLKSSSKKNLDTHPDAAAIYRQVLLGLAGIRTRGFHFPGYFPGIELPQVGEDHLVETADGTRVLETVSRDAA